MVVRATDHDSCCLKNTYHLFGCVFYEDIVMKFEYIFKKINTLINYFVLFIGIIFMQQLAVLPLTMTSHINTGFPKIILTIIGFSIQIFIALFLYNKLFKIGEYTKDAGIKSIMKLVKILVSVLLAMVIIQICSTYLQDMSVVTNTDNQKAILKLYKYNSVGLIIETVIIAPILEELIFRGVFLSGWSTVFGISKISLGSGIFISSGIIALLHTTDFSINLKPYFVAGVILASSYIKTKRIEIPILGHMFLNFLAFII